MEDIRTFQQQLINDSARKQWGIIEQGIDHYLGRKVTEADAPDIEVLIPDHAFGVTKVTHKGVLIGTLSGGWDDDFENNLIKLTWTWTPNYKII